MGKLMLKKGGALILISLLFFSCHKENEKGAREIVERVLEEREDTVDIFGTVVPGISVSLSFDTDIAIREILIENRSEVEAGDTIMVLDLDNYQTEIRTAENSLDQAQLELSRLRQEYNLSNRDTLNQSRNLSASIKIAEKEMDQLKESLERKSEYNKDDSSPEISRLKNDMTVAKTELKLLESEAENKRDLLEESMVSRQQREEADRAVEKQKLSIESILLSIDAARQKLKDELISLELQINQKETDLEDLRFKLDSLRTPEQAAVEMQEFRVGNLKSELEVLKRGLDEPWLDGNNITALYDKTIVSYPSDLSPGDRVAKGTLLMSQINLNKLEISASIPEEFIGRVKPGYKAEIKSLADRNRLFSGSVRQMAGMAINNNGETSIPVRLIFDDPDLFLRPNFNVDISIKVPKSGESEINDNFEAGGNE